MLVQTPSRICKADFASWEREKQSVIRRIIRNEDHTGHLKTVTEIMLDESGSFEWAVPENSTLLILMLYGKIRISGFRKIISPEEVFTLKSTGISKIRIKNYLRAEKTDFLMIELQPLQPENTFFTEKLQIGKRNILFPVSEKLEFPNFIGLYEGRQEQVYALRPEKTIFGMVINGAFEFQNRLLETRDSIILHGIENLEFEALSENALIVFFEI
jgi:quercetin 2,3-dioxygenase